VNTSIEIANRSIRNTSPFNVYGVPVVPIPCGFTSQVSRIGLQIAGPPEGKRSF